MQGIVRNVYNKVFRFKYSRIPSPALHIYYNLFFSIFFSVVQGLGSGSFSGIDGRGDKLVFTTYNDGIFIRDMKTFEQTYYSAEKLKYSVYI